MAPSSTHLSTIQPIHFPSWLEEHAHLLKPPVGNHLLQRGDFVIMIVGGPNTRSDFHVNPTEEWFHQYKGNMTLRIVTEEMDNGETRFRDIQIREGEMFLLPANVPHNPIRYANTVGIVIERNRPDGLNDKLRWFCRNCTKQVRCEEFRCTDLGTQLKPLILEWRGDDGLRTCPGCAFVNPPE